MPQFYHNFTIEPLCSPRNKSTVCNNTRSKHGAITVKSRQIQCRLSRPIGLFMKYRLVSFHVCPCYLSTILNNHTCVKSIILTRSIRILYNLECFYLRPETNNGISVTWNALVYGLTNFVQSLYCYCQNGGKNE